MRRPMSGNPRFQALVSITLAAIVYGFSALKNIPIVFFGGFALAQRRFTGLREDLDLPAQQAAS